jgi:hypothetical protein
MNPEVLFPLLLALAVGVAAITSQSLWMDEGATAIIAGQSSPAGWWRQMSLDAGSDKQMPLYLIFVWGWEKIWGAEEWMLRAANLPWFALGLLAIPRRQSAFTLLLLTSPFVWYYLDEARPYAMQIGAALLFLGGLWRLVQADGRRTSITFAAAVLGLVLLSGSSLLGMIWAGAFLLSAIFVLGRAASARLVRENPAGLLGAAAFLGVLAAYYGWTLVRGAHAAPGETGAGNAVFAAYELLGFAGLGPGRADIRDHSWHAFLPYAPLLLVQAAVTAAVLWAGGKRLARRFPLLLGGKLLAVLGTATAILLAAGKFEHFRVLGRHFAPLAPLLICWLAFGLRELWTRGKGWRLLAAALVLLELASALSLRFASRHAKDDYREAARLAREAVARDQNVWWCADYITAAYYGVSLVPPDRRPMAAQMMYAVNLSAAALASQPPPDLVVLSRPEINDAAGGIRDLLARLHYRLAAAPPQFTLWQKSETPGM